MTEKLEALCNFIRDELGYDGNLEPDSGLLEEDILDSFSIVELAVYVQGSLGVELQPEDLSRDNFATLSSILSLIDERSTDG